MKMTKKFSGRHYETGSVHNALMLQGVKAPHTQKPYSEAFLLGASGGIVFGYFTFAYKGVLPHIALLTRNTFDPLQTLLERLGVEQTVFQTTSASIAEKNLTETLNTGAPALVWVDECSMPYSHKKGAAYWNMIPVVAFGIDGDEVLIADRAANPFRVPMDALTKARGRVKDDRFRIVTLASPLTSKLVSATQKGIWSCISLFTDKPPKGARTNFGFAAYEYFAEMLVNKRNKHSWQRLFPAGAEMYNALAGTAEAPGVFAPPGLYAWIRFFGADGANRALFADFLDEASILLGKNSLSAAARQFRTSHELWIDFADSSLPSPIPPFQEAKSLINKKHRLLFENRQDSLREVSGINKKLKKIEADVAGQFPLSPGEAADFRAGLRERLLRIAEAEKRAVEFLQSAMK